MDRRNFEKAQQQPKAKQERRLSRRMLNVMSEGETPEQIAAAKELNAGWQAILEKASPEQRNEFFDLHQQSKEKMVEFYYQQYREQPEDDKPYETDD